MSQVNRLCFGILMISLVFLMIPSTLVGIAEFANLPVFQILGPFYIIGLLLAGIFNGIIYVTLHVEIRRGALDMIRNRISQIEPTI
uniref:DUF485 domain-containing protein n=1 Tax=Panagrolaimus sp. JU765 TaxID=591449 RepID=A0AC34R8F7_9BILA